MQLPTFSVAIGICVAIYYIFIKDIFKRNKIEPAEVPLNLTTSNSINESESQFTDRCFTFINNWFTRNNTIVYSSNDKQSFKITYDDGNDVFSEYFIESYYTPSNRLIIFRHILAEQIPDNKLMEISEFINRLNELLLVGSIFLNYQNRRIENRLIYYVGEKELEPKEFEFHYDLLLTIKIHNSVQKIIEDNVNPALVALDWSS